MPSGAVDAGIAVGALAAVGVSDSAPASLTSGIGIGATLGTGDPIHDGSGEATLDVASSGSAGGALDRNSGRGSDLDSLGGVTSPTDGCPLTGVGDIVPPSARPDDDAERIGVDASITIPPRLGVCRRCERRMRYDCSSSVSGSSAMAPSSSAAKSSAFAWRAAGSAASALSNASCSDAGQAISGRTPASVAGLFIRRANSASVDPAPWKALCPVRTRKAIRASAYRSDRSSSGSPVSCSGLI